MPAVRRHRILLLAVALLALQAGVARAATNVVIQGTTDVRDAGLLDDVIKPGFHAAYPQYNLQYIAVGTGQALTNAEAGGGDGVLTHAPSLEAQFVANGFSAHPYGRAIFYSDYVVIGPKSADAAGIASGNALHDAVHAFELIAAAGAAGHSDFVSRGDNSGTNVEEKAIWKLTHGVTLNTNGEPGTPGTTTTATWYHKAGLGQAATVQLADQCTFPSGACYDITDRGTFNRLVKLGTATHTRVVSDRNTAAARGGINLLVNSFHYYVVNAAKVHVSLNAAGAEAFGNYLTSLALQLRLATYPNAANPAFFQDARPLVTATTSARVIDAGKILRIQGTVASRLPGASALSGAPLSLFRHDGGGRLTRVGTGHVSASGAYSFAIRPTRGGRYEVSVPAFHDLQALAIDTANTTVRAVVGLKPAAVSTHSVRLTGTFSPARGHGAAVLRVYGRRNRGHFHVLATMHLRKNGKGRFADTLHLGSGRWHVYVQYLDRGVVLGGTSRTRVFDIS